VEFTAAIVKEQGVRFVVALVRQQAMQPANRESTRQSVSSIFPGDLVVLCAQDSRGVPSYFGRPDIVKFLANIHIGQLPWKRYRATAA
jgi:hypothetical protein